MNFASDDGSADAEVLAALVAASSAGISRAELVARLRSARLLIAVQQQPGESEMSTVLFKSNDGRLGLPAFTSLQSLQAWQPTARPLPRTARDLARDCVDHRYEALLIDLASEHRTALTGIELTALAV